MNGRICALLLLVLFNVRIGPATVAIQWLSADFDNDLHITDEEMHEEIYVHELDTGMAENAEYEEEWISFSDEEDEEEDDAEQLVFIDDDEANRNNTFSKKLQLWALSHRIPHAALNDLLEIVQETTEYYVPKDARTFLKTPVGVGKQIASVAGGQLWYQGIQNTLQYHFRTGKLPVNKISVNLFVDGLPLHHSGPTQLWPIMMQLHELPEEPIMVLGIFCGSSEPDNVEDYLRPLVSDLNNILETGIIIHSKKITISLRAIIADTPARAFIKGMAYLNAAHGCIKCKIVGRHDKRTRRMIFEGVAAKRTDAEFRSGQNAIGHQWRPTPIADIIGLDIIKHIPVSDDLHLLHSGFMKLFVIGHAEGTLSSFPKWTLQEQEEVSTILLKTRLPAEIDRAMRSLKCVKCWKGSEFRTFLNHISIPLLKGRIHDDAYHHFKLFYVAITLLSSSHFKELWDYAEVLLEKFVAEFSLHYHKSYITSHIHNLLHIADDVREIGPLPTISSYPFEKRLQFIKSLVRTGHRTLDQVVSRLTELRELEIKHNKTNISYPIVKHNKAEVIFNITSKFMLRKGNRNGWFLTKENEIIRYSSVKQVAGSYVIEGQQLLRKQAAFSYPIASETVYNFQGKLEDISQEIVQVELSNVRVKLVAISVDGISFHFSPLLHTLM
ncbi:uncharacterized protein LOC118505369 isoform X2 [Anopheles stephensi]|uniref:uncharacterized protein LOC118505369 isoform X2 n=1 Tax=Anopheles stephensi TaxID=30069 RepID=UPI001658AF1E|nr:uncharacterized protein LOC118505369 isoform X2 [Anopheles stephensi]